MGRLAQQPTPAGADREPPRAKAETVYYAALEVPTLAAWHIRSARVTGQFIVYQLAPVV